MIEIAGGLLLAAIAIRCVRVLARWAWDFVAYATLTRQADKTHLPMWLVLSGELMTGERIDE